MINKGKKVFVMMSGGVDSSVAAFLLQKQGYLVTGFYMRNWHAELESFGVCPWKEDAYDARLVASRLNIPCYVVDFSREYRDRVVEYMIEGYRNGVTPNPDIMCNREIKFGIFYKFAMDNGADYVATGHYARTKKFPIFPLQISQKVATAKSDFFLKKSDENYQFSNKRKTTPEAKITLLESARDLKKDQSYFLWTLSPAILSKTIFPLGNLLKKEVREIARSARLPVADKKDSQGICFVGKVNVRDFIARYITEARGPIFDLKGEKIGEHSGIQFYTIGQRHGLAIGGGEPLYVVEKRVRDNALVVARGKQDPQLYHTTILITDPLWHIPVKTPLRCEARIRYQQPLSPCVVTKKNNHYYANFTEPLFACAPGQSVVLYRNGCVVGGGTIG